MPAFSLDEKFTLEEGTILASGLQALARVPLDQHRADVRAGLNTATFISGYRGSPLAGFDSVLVKNKNFLDAHNVVFQPGVNEDLGATAVFGSQIANLFPHPKFDGVLGMWYGKAPGVDRSGDIFKHANFAGVGKYGGVLAIAGDDPVSKSSTLPSASELALYDAQMPILYPGNVQEIIELGRYGFELSRYSGLWVGFKIVVNVADEFSTAKVQPLEITRPDFFYNGQRWHATQNTRLVAPFVLETERELVYARLEAAKHFARANKLNRVTVSTNDDWLGIVAAGKTYYDMREAFLKLGLDDDDLRAHGIRLFKINLLYPLDAETIFEFANGLQEILVLEEKRAFLETFFRDALYDMPNHPRILGKRDEHGNVLVRADGELDADEIVSLLIARLGKVIPTEQISNHQSKIINQNSLVEIPLALERSPYFCSGCPHNRSTVVPVGSIAGGGIGCHGMVLTMERETQGITHMGGEGAQWVGAAPFTETKHLFQNIGDGTLFHSGWLAIRQAIAANTNITYKILYNGSVAMTGGQPADGALPIPELTRALAAEGVKKIIVVTEDVKKYRDVRLDVQVWQRDRLDEAQKILRDISGVTVLIYDQPCAADLRRKRKRGLVPDPALRVFINEAVCEGCGDCGVKSNCLSVVPVETEFGRKTQIHQPSCNKDYSCLLGDCPAFVTVKTTEHRTQNTDGLQISDFDALPSAVCHLSSAVCIFMIGIGGTGVVTINQILATAARLDGKFATSLDQTGLSQKGGPVVSHLKIFDAPREVSNKIGAGDADVLLAFDALGAARDENLKRADAEKTVAIVSTSAVATGAMIRKTDARFPPRDVLRKRIDVHTNAEKNIYLDANALAEHFFSSHMFANMIVVGAAFQAGQLPLTRESIERAIELNGEAVAQNKNAFSIGRKVVAEPHWNPLQKVARAGAQEIHPTISPDARALIDSVNATGELKRLLEIRVPELIAYQNAGYAKQYVDFIRRVRQAEARVTNETRWSENVARYLFKLMAYKDEYEVARLHLRNEFQDALAREFGNDAAVTYLLHPPFLRAIGFNKKIKLGKWFDTLYFLLLTFRFLRGTPLDLFGYTHLRKTERALIQEYRALIENESQNLSLANYERAVQRAALPDMIRGYEEIKMQNVEKFRAAVQA